MSPACPACAGPVDPDHRYCERCGHDLRAGDRAVVWRSSTAPLGPCTGCGAAEIGAEGYCLHCGQRRMVGQDRAELELAGVAGVTDRGRHRRHNEDALAIGQLTDARPATAVPPPTVVPPSTVVPPATAVPPLTAVTSLTPVPPLAAVIPPTPVTSLTSVAVVCDGVSSSARADVAAHTATDAAVVALLQALSAGSPPGPATEAATAAAATAVAALGTAGSGHAPPSCTYVSAVVTGQEVTIGWVGDSRGYWLADPPGDPLALTADDSLAGQLAAAGRPVVAGPGTDPRAYALIRWLGADATDTVPHLVTFTPPGPGQVLLCSDGLSRYLPDPAGLAAAARTVPAGCPVAVARSLTQLALDSGGVDNITVALLPFPPPSRPGVSP